MFTDVSIASHNPHLSLVFLYFLVSPDFYPFLYSYFPTLHSFSLGVYLIIREHVTCGQAICLRLLEPTFLLQRNSGNIRWRRGRVGVVLGICKGGNQIVVSANEVCCKQNPGWSLDMLRGKQSLRPAQE